MTLDTSVAGRHFPEDMPAADIGYRCLAVNLSDLAAMGATPRWFLLSLTLPEADPDWLRDFSAGLFELADQAGISLVGGDVTRGPLNVAIQATGSVLPGRALRRDGAQPGQNPGGDRRARAGRVGAASLAGRLCAIRKARGISPARAPRWSGERRWPGVPVPLSMCPTACCRIWGIF